MGIDVRDQLTQRLALRIKVAMLLNGGITGRQLAQKLGVSQTWISSRLTGATPIDVNDLDRIAEALGVSPVDLLAEATGRSTRVTTREYYQPSRIIATIGQTRTPRTLTHGKRPTRRTRPVGAPKQPPTTAKRPLTRLAG